MMQRARRDSLSQGKISNGTSLFSRFAASTAVLAASVAVLAVVFFVVLHRSFLTEVIETTFRGFSLTLAERIWADPQPDLELIAQMARHHRVGIIVVTPDGTHAFSATGEARDPEGLGAGARFRRIDAAGPGGQRISFFWDLVVFARGHVPLLAVLIPLLLFLFGATYAFQLAHLRPLRWLRTSVDAVSQGDLKTRVPVVRQDEIGQVAQAFNRMTQRLDEMMSDRERLLGDVSHELRSPLARIKVALELLPPSAKREAIAKDVREMEALTTALLEREQLRRRTSRLETRAVDLGTVVCKVVGTLAGQGPGVVFRDGGKEVEVQADAALVSILVQNLVENAVKFSLPDSRPVEVHLGTANDSVELTVVDDGPGVPESENDRVKKPFVKLDPARGHGKGYGLGLDLCQRIVEAHSGSLELSPNPGRGTRALVVLPRGRHVAS